MHLKPSAGAGRDTKQREDLPSSGACRSILCTDGCHKLLGNGPCISPAQAQNKLGAVKRLSIGWAGMLLGLLMWQPAWALVQGLTLGPRQAAVTPGHRQAAVVGAAAHSPV